MDYINNIKQSPISMIGVGGVVGSFNFLPPGGSFSVYFDGNDQLALASNAVLSPNDQDFTFEVWLYPNAAWGNSYDSVYYNEPGGTGGFWLGSYNKDWVVRTGGTTNHISIDPAPTVGYWTHVAVTRSGSTLRVFYNGAEKGSVTNSTNWLTGITYIGNDGGGSTYVGYMSNLRFIKGTALYTSTFTPPSIPLTNVTNTKLLCCQDNSSVTAAAVAPETITTSGGTTASRDQYPFPYVSLTDYSVEFGGSADALNIPDDDAWHIETNYTAECWFYADSATGSWSGIMGQWPESGGGVTNSWVLEYVGTDLRWYYVPDGGSLTYKSLGTISTGAWHHFALSKSGSTTKIYIDGVENQSWDMGTLQNGTGRFVIGGDVAASSGSGWFDGKISNIRITQGQALYTSAFTPSVAPLTTTSQGAISTNVKLLCCGGSSATSSAVTPGTITTVASPTGGQGGPW